MKIIFFQSLFSLNCMALSWLCDYPEIDGPTTTHVLYKEETANVVKWLEKYEYCRAKGDPLVYVNAGRSKCEYSRNLCVFINDECVFNQQRENDPLEECQSLLYDNILSNELDWGRMTSTISCETSSATDGAVDGTVTDGSVTDGSVTDGTFTDGAVTDGTVTDGTVTDGSVTDGAVTDGTVTDGTVTDGTADGAVTDGAVTDGTEDIFFSSAKIGAKSILLAFSFFLI